MAEDAQIIVHKNKKLEVYYGRSVFIRPRIDLSFLYKPDGNCQVYVLKDEPTHYKFGGIYPSIFPCNFNEKEVKYQHFGGIDVLEDMVKMHARLDTGTQTVVQPFSIHVSVAFNVPSEVLQKKADLIVEEIGGLSDPISNTVLQFSFDQDREACFIHVINSNSGPPYFGRLIHTSGPIGASEIAVGQKMECSRFTDGSLRYIHKKALSSNRDYIPLVVEIADKKSNQIEQREFIRVPVRIRRAPENERPTQAFEALFSTQVDQSIITAITPEVLAVTDKETDSDLLILNVTRPLGPGEGELINTDNPNVPIRTFYQRDIKNLKIAYKPSKAKSSNKRVRQIWFEAIDGDGAKSIPFYVFIIVNDMNTAAPRVVKNTGLSMFEGQSRTLDGKVLDITSRNNPNDVKISVIHGVKHGQIEVLGKSVRSFTLSDIRNGLVRYIHDDSNTYSDNFVLRIKDGKYQSDVLISVTIIPRDDEAPILDHNIGMTLEEGKMAQINQFMLGATDVDSDETKLVYTLVDPPLAGGLCYRQSSLPDQNEVGWVKSGSFYTKNITEFLQSDIIMGRVYYKHYDGEVFSDRFTFRVRDDNTIPNQSGLKTFVINIIKIDDLKPKLFPACPLAMKAMETVVAKFNKANMRYYDDDTDDDKLIYRVTRRPYFSASQGVDGSVDAGSIVLEMGASTKKITTFSQKQVNHFKVGYEPPVAEIGRSRREVKFEFSVEDTAGNKIRNQVFTIDLHPKNNKPPVGIINTVPVDERRDVIITKRYLDVKDEDNAPQDISLGLEKSPAHGALVHSGRKMLPGDLFEFEEITRNNIVYSHDGSETLGEQLDLRINDGFHSVPIILPIVVNPVDDQAPTVKYLAKKVEVLERGIKTLTKDIISGTDEDTDDESLTFLIVSGPLHGAIEKQGTPVSFFTQKDIFQGLVTYRHTDGEIGLKLQKDSVNLTLSDLSDEWLVGGNRYDGIVLNFEILPVDSEPPVLGIERAISVVEGLKATLDESHLKVTDVDTPRLKIVCKITEQPTYGFIESITPAKGSELSRMGLVAKEFSNVDLINGKVNYVQSKHKEIEPTVDQLKIVCADKNNTSVQSTLNVLIEPRNDEKPVPLVREFIVLENDYISFDLALLNALDADIPTDELVFYVKEEPKHGQLLRQDQDLSPIYKFSKTELIASDGGILYQHDGSETQRDSFVLIVSDGVHNVSTTVPVRIIAVDDEVPHMTINTGLRVERDEMKVVTNRNIKATDLDSENKNLIYFVMTNAKFGSLTKRLPSGQFLNLTKGTNFTQNDVDSKTIYYHHTDKGNAERDVIRFDLSDGYNRLINQLFYVIIAPIDNMHPDVINKGVTLKEGDRITLTTDLLSASDINSRDENLVYQVNKLPTKGYLENTDHPGVPITNFKQLDLAGNKIVYVHTSSDEIKIDNFEFSVSDGVNKIHRTFRITLTDVDNKKPVLHINILPALEGKNTIITPFELRAEDKDTKPENLVFAVTQLPLHGQIIKDGISTVNSFTQSDIDGNHISYRHDGSESKSDSFSIVVTDGTHSDFFVFPNSKSPKTESQVVHIKIRPVDNKLPVVAKNLGASALQNFDDGMFGFQLTEKALQAHDSDSDNKNLMYYITSPAKHGKLVNASSPKETLTMFTQKAINDGQVRYVLNDKENATSDMFVFKLVDAGGNTLYGQQFYFNWAWVSFSQSEFNVSESNGQLIVTLNRRGFLGETSFVSLALHNGSATEKEDFQITRSNQVQFSPGQARASLKIKIIDDLSYESMETFQITLVENIHALVGEPGNVTVTIFDQEDKPTVEIQNAEYVVQEGIGTLNVPLRRRGDLKPLIKIVCITIPGTASGTLGSTVTSYRDYISKAALDIDNVITFDTNEVVKQCPVKIIDDSLYEKDEKFKVKLLPYMGAAIGDKYSSAEVIILADDRDEPAFTFEKNHYEVDEDVGVMDVVVRRKGSDLAVQSSILFATRQWRPISARAERDYVPQVQSLTFAPGEAEKIVKLIILDDIARPRIEGKENFTVLLRAPLNATLGENPSAIVTIDDTKSDLPTVYFDKRELKVRENSSFIIANIKRRGDLRHVTSVRCYTRQDSAIVAKDYVERPNTNASFVVFKPRETIKPCKVFIINDTVEEPTEQFRLHLGKVFSSNKGGGKLGGRNTTIIKIVDDDQPVIKFMNTKFYAKEPPSDVESRVVEIPVFRSGDTSRDSVVMAYTRDGSAKSGVHYEPFAKKISFANNATKKMVKLRIFHDKEKGLRRAFSLYLKPDENEVASLGLKKMIIYIEEHGRRTGVTFPLKPRVASLRDYDDLKTARKQPIQGYPLICVTACNPKFPDYSSTAGICKSEKIDNDLTRYRWQISARDSQDGVTHTFKNVESRTFFTETNKITLDSVYFGPGTRVRCVAQAVDENEGFGVESYSDPVTVDPSEGLCMPRNERDIGAETFSAQVKYTGAKDPKHPNLIRVRILVPHFDGLLPAISTRQLSNFEIALSPDASRVAQHTCSNLLDINEIRTRFGFLKNGIIDPDNAGESLPYQYDIGLRGNATLRFYRHLNLDACLWTFESYYDMTELVQKCGGSITTDGQVKDTVQSHMSVKVPLYVSYIYHSPTAAGGWMHFDHRSSLRLTFVYDTAVLWKDGVGPPATSILKGNLYPTSIRIRDSDRKLVVNFRTKARFRGQFIMKKDTSRAESIVMSPDQPSLTMTLSLIRSDQTYSEPEQLWQFVSNFAVRDYSGLYIVRLVPCTVTEDIEYSLPLECTPRNPITFELPIRFQQTSEPVEANFSLDTRFFLLNRQEQWTSNKFTGSEATDVAFTKGSTIYGRVMIDTAQSLGSAYHVVIEKVYLCSGLDGYVPKFDPSVNEFGCLADSENLLYRFKVLDRLAPSTITTQFDNVRFNALFAYDDNKANELVNNAGADGFRLDSEPLFKVSGGRNWFLHTIYTVRSESQKNRGVGKRSIDYMLGETKHSMIAMPRRHRRRRELEELKNIGKSQGTNIQMIRLLYGAQTTFDSSSDDSKISNSAGKLPEEVGNRSKSPVKEQLSSGTIAGVIVAVVVLLIIIAAVIFYKRRKPKEEVKRTGSAVSVGDQDGTEI